MHNGVYIFAVFSFLALIGFLVVSLKQPKKLTLKVKSDGKFYIFEVDPSPMPGIHTVEISELDHVKANICDIEYLKAREVRPLLNFGKHTHRSFICPKNDTFVLCLSQLVSNKPSLIGLVLPAWNLRGERLCKTIFKKSIDLKENVEYEVSIDLKHKGLVKNLFCVKNGIVYMK